MGFVPYARIERGRNPGDYGPRVGAPPRVARIGSRLSRGSSCEPPAPARSMDDVGRVRESCSVSLCGAPLVVADDALHGPSQASHREPGRSPWPCRRARGAMAIPFSSTTAHLRSPSAPDNASTPQGRPGRPISSPDASPRVDGVHAERSITAVRRGQAGVGLKPSQKWRNPSQNGRPRPLH